MKGTIQMVASKTFLARALLIAGVSVVLLTSIVAQLAAIGLGRATQLTSRLVNQRGAFFPGNKVTGAHEGRGFTQSPNADLWVGSWSCSPVPPLTQAPPLPPGIKEPEGDSLFTIPPPAANATVRMIVRGTAGGDKVRIRVSNFYGKTPLQIGAAHIALREAGSGIKSGTDRALTFSGQPSIAVSPGAMALSDPVALSVPPNTDIAVSLFFPEAAPEKRTVHFNAVEDTYTVQGAATGQAKLENARSAKWAYFLVGVDVSGATNRGTIVAIGDSITDGGSLRWPALLAARLLTQKKNYGVLNQGIAGNRILGQGEDDFGAIFGVNALARLERDVFGQPNVKYLILYEGINDIGLPGAFGAPSPPVTPAQVIAGMRQVIARAREHGLVIYGATLAPFEGTVLPGYYAPEKEVTRQAVNQWIRAAKEFDGYFDFDKALQDPAHPARLKPEYDSGDHLHPNDAGEKAMSEAIDLSRFK
jgi:lysophospholipase L1-like esterase